jgi:hypothetical protein
MNLSRGFRRLSVLAGLVGLALLLFLGFGPNGTLHDTPLWAWVVLLLTFVGGPFTFVSLVGWVVIGFRNSN